MKQNNQTCTFGKTKWVMEVYIIINLKVNWSMDWNVKDFIKSGVTEDENWILNSKALHIPEKTTGNKKNSLTDSCFGAGERFYENSAYFFCRVKRDFLEYMSWIRIIVTSLIVFLCPLASTAAGAIFITTRSHGYSSLPGLSSMFVVN